MLDLNSLPHHVETIINRHGLKLFIRYNGEPSNGRKLAIVAHGLSDVHDSSPLRAITSGLIESGYNVIAYDATNSWGRSEGRPAEATLTGAYEDLIDVVKWARAQPTYNQASIVFAGHSLGGAAALRLAFDQPQLVERLVLIAPVVSGDLLAERLPRPVRELWRIVDRLPEPGQRGKVYRYNLLRDGLSYDGIALAAGITASTTIIGAGRDILIRRPELERLCAAFPTCTLTMINDADHVFSGYEEALAAAVSTAH